MLNLPNSLNQTQEDFTYEPIRLESLEVEEFLSNDSDEEFLTFHSNPE